MAALDNDALVCDFAQYYGIRNYRELELPYAAVLASGLPVDARIMRVITGQKFDVKTMLLANLVDYMALDVWMQTKDGHKNRNRPKSVVAALSGKTTPDEDKSGVAYATAEDFEAARRKILEMNNG